MPYDSSLDVVSFTKHWENESDRVEGEASWDMKQISPDLGVFFVALLT